jgi:PKD repeat protein
MSARARLAIVLTVFGTGGVGCQEPTGTDATAPLSVDCAAAPASGAVPLTVAFGLDVRNATGAASFSISYGDGAQGNDPDARHVYTVAGDYVASITVTAGGQTARCWVPIAVTPAPGTPATENRWPEPSFRTTPPAVGDAITGKAPLTVQFNMCRSLDPDGDPLFFRMDLDGDGVYELAGATGGDCRHEAAYAVGARTVTLCVTDVDCPGWPSCSDIARLRLHPYQCQSYSLTATQ